MTFGDPGRKCDSYAVRFLAEMGSRSSEIVEKMNELMGAETELVGLGSKAREGIKNKICH